MKWFNDAKLALLFLAFAFASMLTGGSANADFTFGEPVKVESVMARTTGSRWNAIDCLSYDGLEMYISLFQPGGDGHPEYLDLCVLKCSSIEDDRGPAENLGPGVNSPNYDVLPSISADGGTRSIALTVKPAKRYAPTADAGGPYTGVVGQPIRFDASGSYDPDGEIIWYGWDFDGDAKYDATGSATCEHTWDLEFSGTVTLLVTDNDGLGSIATTSVVVTAP